MILTRPIHQSGFAREAHDFYATPDWVTEALLRRVTLRGPVWEPCCGTGAMARVLERAGHTVIATDIADRGYGTPGIDLFRSAAMPAGCRSLVTNPPYGEGGEARDRRRSPSAMLDLVRHLVHLGEAVEGQVAVLVRLQWIAGARAAALLARTPCVAVVALTKRIRWFDMGERTNQAQHHHAWLVFDHAAPRPGAPALLFEG